MKKPKKPIKAIRLEIDAGKPLAFDALKVGSIPLKIANEATKAMGKGGDDLLWFDADRWEKSLTKKELAELAKLQKAEAKAFEKLPEDSEKDDDQFSMDNEFSRRTPPTKEEINYSKASSTLDRWRDSHGLHICNFCRYYELPIGERLAGKCKKLNKFTRPSANACPKFSTDSLDTAWEMVDECECNSAYNKLSAERYRHWNDFVKGEND